MKDRDSYDDILNLSDLRQMEVIELSEGKRLGFISDIIFDDDLTHIESLVIPPQSGLLSIFKRKEEMCIKWDQIKIIGVDIILVDMSFENANDR